MMNDKSDQLLDRLAREVTRQGGLNDEDLERVVSNPFFNARVRARIDAERERRASRASDWFVTLLIAGRAIAILALVAIAAAVTFWMSRPGVPGGSPANKREAIGRIAAGGTCALSSTEECAISNDEVLATLFAEEGGGTQK